MISINSANQLGTQMAANGWSVEQVKAWFISQLVTGKISQARVLRAYNEQIARG